MSGGSRRGGWGGSSGVTLVELLVALFLAGMVTVAAGVIYLTNQRSFGQGREKLLVQQNASFCLEEVARDLRRAWRVDHINGQRIVLYDVDGFSYGTWELGDVGGENRVMKNGISMVPEECTALLFTVPDADTSSIGIVMEFRDDVDNRVRIGNTVKLRNFEAPGPTG